MSQISIVHAPDDQNRITPLAHALRAAGIDVGGDDGAVVLAVWTKRSVDSGANATLLDQADRAKARGAYAGVKLDDVDLPFGFGGLQLFDLSGWVGSAGDPRITVMAAALKARLAGASSGANALSTLPDEPTRKRNLAPILAIAVVLLVGIGLAIFFFMRSGEPSLQDRIAARFATIPCAWLRIDPVENGKDGKLALTGVAGDPVKAGETIRASAKADRWPIEMVTIDKVAQIDPRECAAIEGPIKLRKDLGGRLRVTGEPFILNTSRVPHQALVRVQITLRDKDRSMTLLGVEPSGQVTWSLPDIASVKKLKNYDVGLVETGRNAWEFNIYPDHLGWTGLLLVAGDSPLAKKLEQGAVQSAGDFAKTITEATASGQWDAEMTWFRIDPNPGG